MGLWAVLTFLLWQNPDYLEQGRKALEARQNEQAAELFRKAVAADDKDYAAHFHLGLAESLLQHDPEAITEFERTLALKPGLYQAELNLGMLLFRDKREADAVPHLQNAVSQKPGEFRPNYYLGESLLKTGKPDEAQPYFEAALKINEKSAPAELGLARSLLARNQLPESEPHFRKAAELDPDFRDALLELAAAEEKSGRPKEAIAIYQQFPANAGAQERLGELLIEDKQFAEAIPRLEKAVAESPTVANRLALATAYRMNKQPDKQDEQLQKAVATDSANYELRMILGRALRDERKLAPASAEFYAAAKLKPESVEAWNELASALIVNENYEQGLAALDRVRQLGKETPGNRYFRAITLDKLHQLPQALASYKEFLATSEGKFPDQEFAARQRIRIIEKEMSKR